MGRRAAAARTVILLAALWSRTVAGRCHPVLFHRRPLLLLSRLRRIRRIALAPVECMREAASAQSAACTRLANIGLAAHGALVEIGLA